MLRLRRFARAPCSSVLYFVQSLVIILVDSAIALRVLSEAAADAAAIALIALIVTAVFFKLFLKYRIGKTRLRLQSQISPSDAYAVQSCPKFGTNR